ncbi:MAG: M48 family metalloprotease [Treponema sp.]|jgi:predicted Zn-dependent protease|nr:M48 family metalloprotease [Treponema sp.]
MKPLYVFLFLAFLISPKAPAQSTGMGSFPPDIFDAFSRMDSALTSPPAEYSPEDMYYLGRAVGAGILGQYKPLPDSALTQYLNLICTTIAINSPQPAGYNGYQVTILDSPELNAFATPGGHIFICRGMVEAVDSEDALAAIIAHELAHIQLQHGIEIIQATELARSLSETADRAAALIVRDLGLAERTLIFGTTVRDLASTLLANGYSQTQEFAADAYALELLSVSGYAPSGMAAVLRILEETDLSEGFNATHPPPLLRIVRVQDALRKYPPRDPYPVRNTRHQTRTRR